MTTHKKIESIQMLKHEASEEEYIECFIMLRYNIRSSKIISFHDKPISFYEDKDIFVVLNLIDGSEEELSTKELEESNIGEAIRKGCFWMDVEIEPLSLLDKYKSLDVKMDMTEIIEFANRTKQLTQLLEILEEVNSRSENTGSISTIYKDFAPYSMGFTRINIKDNNVVMKGGIIYHGAHDGYGSGDAPTFSVTLDKTDGWSIHT